MPAGGLRQPLHAPDDPLRVGSVRAGQLFDGRLHPRDRMLRQQLEHPHVLPDSRPDSVPLLQTVPKFLERSRQLPVAVHVRVIQRRRSTAQGRQVMPWIENLLSPLVAPRMLGHDRLVEHDLHPLDVALHRHRLKGTMTRDAVGDVVEAGELVLVDLRRLADAGIEPMLGERGCLALLLGEAFTDCLGLPAARAVPLPQTALPEKGVEFLKVLDFRHRRGPLPFQGLHPVLHHRLLVPLRRKTEQRFEHVMAGQGRITFVELAGTSRQQRRGHRFRVVPPHLPRDTAEELEGLRHPLQNRLGPLRRQSHGKGSVRIRPDQDQYVHLAAAGREIDLDLAEVRLDPLTRFVMQRDECLLRGPLVLIHEPPHRVVPAGVPMLIPQPLENPHPRVTLLRRSRLVLLEHRQDRLVKSPQLGSRLPLPLRIRLRFAGASEHLANRLARVPEPPGHLPNAHPISMSPPNASVMFHREHPCLR